MKMFFVTLMTIVATKASAETLYQRLEKMFSKSTMPYPVESKFITDVNSPAAFKNCVMVDEKGNETPLSDLIFFQLEITVKADGGPLSPGVKNVYARMGERGWVDIYAQYGGQFNRGVINLDQAQFQEGYIRECKDQTTIKDVYKKSRSGLSSDGRSYDMSMFCNDGSPISIDQNKMAEGYLVQKSTSFWPFTSVLYTYCWN